MADPLLQRLPEPPQKVAVVKPSRIGDFICAGPAFRALRAALPHAEISLISLPMLQELASRLPFFDHFIPFPGYPGVAEQLFEPARALAFFADMQRDRFDLAIQLQGSGVYSNPVTLMLGARYSAGFIRPEDNPGRLDAALPLPAYGHEIDRMLAMPVFLGARCEGRATVYPLHAEDHRFAETVLARFTRPLIGVHPGANHPERRWFSRGFITVARALLQRRGGSVVVLGSKEEAKLASTIAAAIGPDAVNLAGRLSLPVLGGVLSRLGLLLTNDTGPAHIAYALKTPTVTVLLKEEAARYSPPSGPFEVVRAQPEDGSTRVLAAAERLSAKRHKSWKRAQ